MTIRTEEVLPPSMRAETSAVLRAAAGIVIVALVVATLQAGSGAVRVQSLSGGASSPTWAGEATVAFTDLSAADQRSFRDLSEGLIEAENLRAQSGQWPSVELLSSQGIPPFARDPLDRAQYAWSCDRKGTLINYTGIPAEGSERSCFLALILEPDPGTPIDPGATTDEIHHRLPDGVMLHVAICRGPRLADLGEPWPAVPDAAGWARITRAN